MAAPALSTLSVILIAVFLAAFGATAYLVIQFQNKAHRELADLSARMTQLEREYLRIKPEVERMGTALDDRVDYATMEKKIRELIAFVGEKFKGRK